MKAESPSRPSSLGSSAFVVAFSCLLLFSQMSAAQTANFVTADYDAVRDFSIVSNPNGVWSYGWTSTLGSPLNLYTVMDSTTFPGLSGWLETGMTMYAPPLVGHNDTSSVLCFLSFCVPPTFLQVHPGVNNELSVVRWTAPATGNFLVQGKVVGLDRLGPTSTNFYLVRNSRNVPVTLSIIGYQMPQSFQRVIALSAGDTLDFAVDFGGNGYNADSTGIQFNVTQVE